MSINLLKMCLTYKCNIYHFSFDFMNIQVHVKNVL